MWNGIPRACKYVRRDADKPSLHNEHTVLVELGKKDVPNIPRVEHKAGKEGLLTSTDGKEGLVMSPVGTDLWSNKIVGTAPRIAFAAKALGQVWNALIAAHAAGYVHTDVRPSNIIRAKDDSSKVVLIDWGLAEGIGGAFREAKLMMGEVAFFGGRRLDIVTDDDKWKPEPVDDLQSAVLMACALAETGSVHAPWPMDWLKKPKQMDKERAEWIHNADELMRSVAAAVTVPAAKEALEHFLDECKEASRT